MGKLAQEIEQQWRSQLNRECTEQSTTARESILSWLIGIDVERFENLDNHQLEIARSAIAYRYRILKERYLGIAPEGAYSNLIKRLGSVVLLRSKISTGIALSRDRHRGVADVLQEVVQELLQSDRYMQQQMTSIAEFTKERRLQNALLFATTEEYCLRPVRNQPLLAHRFINYLRRSQRGGITNVPVKDLVRLVSQEVMTEESDSPVNLLDSSAIAEYENERIIEAQQAARSRVKKEFCDYVTEKLGTNAAQWLELYLQGKTPEAIAQSLNLDIKKVYRLREKVSYHAVQVFSIKDQSPMVDEWLETSLEENNFGLLPQQWVKLWAELSQNQRQLVEFKKAGKDIEEIALELKLKPHQVIAEWGKIYVAAQALRSQA